MQYAQVHAEEKGDITVVRICDSRVSDFLKVEELGAELYRLLEEKKCLKLVLDLSGVEYLSSSALGKLVSLNGRLKTRGGQLRLCGLQPLVADVFNTCRLDRLLDIKRDTAEALGSF